MTAVTIITGIVCFLVGAYIGTIIIEQAKLLNTSLFDKVLLGVDELFKAVERLFRRRSPTHLHEYSVDTSEEYSETLSEVSSRMRDLGWFRVKFPKFITSVPLLLEHGIQGGIVLEVGSGADYLGLEWLKTSDSAVTGQSKAATRGQVKSGQSVGGR